MSGQQKAQFTQPGSPGGDPEVVPVESSELGPEALEGLQLISDLDRTASSEYVTDLHFYEAQELLEFFLKDLNDGRWVFRGHGNASWRLQPSAERLGKNHSGAAVEQYILSAFKRRAHQYLTNLPPKDDDLEWLALAQHYGAPTSLLDFTNSPYVATFFAVAEQREEECAAVWAIEAIALKAGAQHLLRKSDDFFNTVDSFGSPEVFSRFFPRSKNPSAIVPLRPDRMNEQLTVQQGLFLYPTSHLWNFELTLKLTLESWCDYVHGNWPQRDHLYKLVIEPSARLGILKELNRMNVTYAALFPGLEGFARSLQTDVLIRDLERPDYGFRIQPSDDDPI